MLRNTATKRDRFGEGGALIVVAMVAMVAMGGMVATTLRLVNAIPAVCDAAPGLVSSLDLPLTVPVDPFHPRPAGLSS